MSPISMIGKVSFKLGRIFVFSKKFFIQQGPKGYYYQPNYDADGFVAYYKPSRQKSEPFWFWNKL